MEDQIIRKLAVELAEFMTTERQVVYLLVEVRKLLDRRPKNLPPYPSLKLYCNWIVHVELSHSQAQELVKEVDVFCTKLMAGTATDAEKTSFRHRFTLNAFRKELGDFFQEVGLPVFSDTGWNSFLACFLRVIEDCPLICRAQDKTLTSVDEVTLIKEVGDGALAADGNPPPIIWALSFGGHHVFTMMANADLSNQTVEALEEFSRRRK